MAEAGKTTENRPLHRQNWVRIRRVTPPRKSAKKPHRLPVVFTREEVRAVLARMQGDKAVMASLLYGSGLRLMERLRLRVKDVDFGQNHIVVRDGKGQKDRVTVLPGSLVDALRKAGRAGGGAGNRDATSS